MLKSKIAKLSITAALVSANLGLPGVSFAVPLYYQVDYINGTGKDLNNLGQVVGNLRAEFGDGNAFVWDKQNGYKDLGTFGAQFSSALSINNLGWIGIQTHYPEVCNFETFEPECFIETKNYLWKNDADYQEIPISPYDINDQGYVIGNSRIWHNSTGEQALPGTAASINEKNQVAGWKFFEEPSFSVEAFLWDSNGTTYLGYLGMPTEWDKRSVASAINDAGQVVGYSVTGSVLPYYRAFVWDAQNGMKDLGVLGGDGNQRDQSRATDINNQGQIIGFSKYSNEWNDHPFLYEDGKMYDLNNFLPEGSGIELIFADKINDKGQILAYAQKITANDQIWGETIGDGTVLLTPVFANPPDCSKAAPSVSLLWPVNNKFVPVDILGVTDPDGDLVTIVIDSIYQDEPVKTNASDGMGLGSATAQVRATRNGSGSGRVYHIAFTAYDDKGKSCSGEVNVNVPHNQGKGDVCVDDGALYDSTVTP